MITLGGAVGAEETRRNGRRNKGRISDLSRPNMHPDVIASYEAQMELYASGKVTVKGGKTNKGARAGGRAARRPCANTICIKLLYRRDSLSMKTKRMFVM
jgi:hypothetical protein